MLTPEGAVDRLELLYDQAVQALIQAVDRFLQRREPPPPAVRALFRYPLLRVTCRHVGAATRNRRAFAKFQRPGVYETTVTHPKRFRTYLLEQLRPLAEEYETLIEVEPGPIEIPYPYVIERIEEISRAGVTAAEMAEYFPRPELTLVGDEVADGQWQVGPDGVRPLALFDGPRVDFSLRRLVHYTGGDWRHVQKWILLTNYHRYVDEFARWAVARLAEDNQYLRLEIPGGGFVTRGMTPAEAEAVIAASPWHRYQMPAYHLVAAEGQG